MLFDSLPDGWERVTLGDVRSPEGKSIVSGPFGSNIGSRFFVESGIPVIRGNNLTTNYTKFIDEGYVFLTEEKAREFINCETVAGDLVFTAAGTLGQVGLIPENSRFPKYIISNKQMRARLNSERIDKLFAFYCLSSPIMVDYIQKRNTGSSVPLINLSVLRSLPVPLPPLAEQKAIVGILSSLDDKIELNRRMNATLESIAQTLFKAWFVDFEPVKAKAAMLQPAGMDAETAALFPSAFEESELGEIPEGWRAGTVGDVAVLRRDTVDPSTLAPDTSYIGLEHMPQKSIALDSWGCASDVDSTKAWFDPMEILFGKLRPYFHKVGVAPVRGICSTDILVLKPKEETNFGLLLATVSSESLVSYASRLADGAKMPRVNWKDVAAYPIPLPPREIQTSFSNFMVDVVRMIHNNIHQSRTLAEIRDTLLPRLISGQLRVPVQELASDAPEVLLGAGG